MLRYFSQVWLNGIRNQTEAFVMVLLMDLPTRKFSNPRKTLSIQALQRLSYFSNCLDTPQTSYH